MGKARELQEKAKEAISRRALPAMRRLWNYLQGTYMNHLRPGAGGNFLDKKKLL